MESWMIFKLFVTSLLKKQIMNPNAYIMDSVLMETSYIAEKDMKMLKDYLPTSKMLVHCYKKL